MARRDLPDTTVNLPTNGKCLEKLINLSGSSQERLYSME
jgi:hypothetical protein